jgi:DNA-binding CsgD family transcriptional regulator
MYGQDTGLPRIPISTIFNVDDYKGGMQNWMISESSEGFLYVANNYGLLEYDGSQWRFFGDVPGHTRTRSVFVDPLTHRIYTGGQNLLGFYDRNELGELQFNSLNHLIPEEISDFDDIWNIQKIGEQILFTTFEEVFVFNGREISVISSQEPFSYTFGVDNQIFTYATRSGLLKWNGDGFSPLHPPIEGVQGFSGIIKESNNSYLLFSTDQGAFRYENGTISPALTGQTSRFKESIINSAIRLRNGTIAIGTQNDGLYVLKPNGEMIYHLTKNKGLNNRTVLTLYEDRYQNLWVGSNNGIAYVELTSPFSVVDERNGLPGTGYTAAIHDNNFYFGTSTGLYVLNSTHKKNENPFELVANTEGQVYNLSKVNGDLILSHHTGAYLVEDKFAGHFFAETGTWRFLANPANGGQMIGGTYDGFYLFNTSGSENTPELLMKIPNLRESSRVFEFDRDSILWMTHGYKGVFSISALQSTEPKIQFYGSENGFPSNILINVFKIADDLVFSAEKGIYRFNKAEQHFELDSVMTSLLGGEEHISYLKEDSFGNIYFISEQHVGVLKRDNLGRLTKELFPFEKINNLISDDLNNISILDHRNILIGARDGFLHYDPMAGQVNNGEINVVIKSMELIGDSTTRYELPANKADLFNFDESLKSIRFNFTSPDFSSIGHVKYSYQLLNFDQDWSPFTSATTKEYTSMPPGKYTFLVKAEDAYGRVSEIERLTFQVHPYWYNSLIAYVMYVIATLALFGFVLYIMELNHRNRLEASEKNQQKILELKENELSEIAQKSEERISQLKNEKLKAEIEHKNRALATTTMHLVNKTDMMNGLKNRLRNIVEHESDVDKEIKQVIKELEKNETNADEWKNFEIHFDHAHSDFLKQLKEAYPELTQQDMKLSAFLRMNMSSKEIASLLNISVRGVEISRYRLRKKLGLDKSKNLVDFMLRFSSKHGSAYEKESGLVV